MGLKFTNTSYGQDGTEWKVDIYDTAFSAASTSFDTVANSLQIRYQADDETRNAAILTSSARFTMVIDDSTKLAFVNGLAVADEGQFRVAISRAGSVEWAGIILTDQITYADRSYPFELEINAVDGIARLKDVEYYDDSVDPPVAYEGKETFVQHLIHIIDKIGTSDLLSSDTLVTGVNWYETNHSATTVDPIAQTRFNHKTLLKFDSKTGAAEYMNTYKVLQEIAKNWHCRFVLSAGSFYLMQINEYENDSFQLFRYGSTGAQNSTATGVSVDKVITDKLAGGTFQFFPGLRKVEMEYLHRLSSNKIPDADLIAGHDVEIDNAGNIQLFFECNLFTEYASGTFTDAVLFEYRFTFSLTDGTTTYYLKREANIENGRVNYLDFEWTTSVLDFVFVYSDIIEPNPIIDLDYNKKFTIIIPRPPVSGDLSISGTFSNVVDFDGTALGISGPGTQSIFDPYLEVADLTDRKNSKVYRADNTATGFTAAISMNSLIGDGPSGNAFGHLEANDGIDWQVTSAWGIGTTAGTTAFHQLLVNQILAGQYQPVKKIIGSFDGVLSGHESLNISGAYHIPNEMTIEAGRGIVSGTFFEVATSASDVAESEEVDWFNPRTPNASGPGSETGDDTVDDPLGDDERFGDRTGTNTDENIYLKIPPFTTDGSIDEGLSISSITVTQATEADVFVTGDKINVIDRFTGQSQTFTVSADVAVGDTSISVTTATTDFEISDRSYVTLDGSQQLAKLNKKWYRQTFSSHTISTLTVTENAGTLPDNTAAIHVYANGQRVFGYTISGSDIQLGFTPPSMDFVVEFWI